MKASTLVELNNYINYSKRHDNVKVGLHYIETAGSMYIMHVGATIKLTAHMRLASNLDKCA